jgi:hypothetical protein
MLDLITVPIPEDETDLIAYFEDQLDSAFRDALNFDVVRQRDRAVLDDVRITDVTITEIGVEVSYEIQFSAYLGCRDMNWADEEYYCAFGKKQDEAWLFAHHKPWTPRSTHDEF